MTVIALIGNKGMGKTTLASNLAAALAQDAPTALIDADPQWKSLHWRPLNGMASRLPVIEAAWNLEQVVDQRRVRFQNVIIDCPASMHEVQTRQALAISDTVLIPVQPTSMQLWSTGRVLMAIEAMRAENPQLMPRLVINQLQLRRRLTPQVQQGLEELDIPVAATRIHQRRVYQDSLHSGHSVQEMGRQGRAASHEIKQLANEVLHHEHE